ncbi:hypothetical protein KUCAC02_029668 [Chaenocephalus aceratus]|nr:hypothetical protein KUCAC02_029668 [Chaenocephalus aceratus]
MMSPCPHLGPTAPPQVLDIPAASGVRPTAPPQVLDIPSTSGVRPTAPPQVLDIPSTSGVRPPHQDVVPAQDEESLSSDIPSPVHSPFAMDNTSPLHSPSSPHLAFARSTFDPEARIDVVFIDIEGVGEGAVDEGGPTREFCTLLMRQIQAYLIFEGPEERRTLALDSVALQKGHYKIIGQIIVVCLLQGLVSPHFLSDRLFQQIAEATTVEAAKEAVEEASEELSLMGGMRFLSNLSQRDELLAAVLHHYCDGRLLEALQQFREGFQICGANKVLIALRTVFIEDTTPIEAEDIYRAFGVSSLSVEGSNRRQMEARTIGFWRDWLQTVEGGERPLSLGDVLQFATGLQKIPVGGFPSPPTLNFLHPEDGHAQFPTANTCAFVLRLPVFRQYDKFQEAMENGISWGATFGLG